MGRYIAVDSILARWYRTSVRGRTEFDQVIANIPSIDLEADYVPKDFHDKTCEAMAKRHQEEIADMVSVVRCQDCKHWNTSGCRDGVGECEWAYYMTKPDDYCSYGERSE